MVLLQLAAIIGGASLVLYTILSAIRVFIVPRGGIDRITAFSFGLIGFVFTNYIRIFFNNDYDRSEPTRAIWAPIGLFILPLTWLTLITIGFAAIYWGIQPELGLRDAFVLSGSSLMTLGYSFNDLLPIIILTFVQAALSMMLVALMIGYLPVMYGAFSAREKQVARLHVMAGNPPTIAEAARRLHFMGVFDNHERARELWASWEDWFLDIEESHTNLPFLIFFRSPRADRSWVVAGRVLLDLMSLLLSTVEKEWVLEQALTLTAGRTAFRSIADLFNIEYDPNPNQTDPISISREEYEKVYHELAEVGIPVKPDIDQCWIDFAGWRVNYDAIIVRLEQLAHVPDTPFHVDPEVVSVAGTTNVRFHGVRSVDEGEE